MTVSDTDLTHGDGRKKLKRRSHIKIKCDKVKCRRCLGADSIIARGHRRVGQGIGFSRPGVLLVDLASNSIDGRFLGLISPT